MAIQVLFNNWFFGLVVIIICSLVIAKAVKLFEASTNYLGRNLTDGVRGMTLNAIGSSIPELLTTVFFLLFASKENLGRDFAASIGVSTGSAIFNSIVIPMLVIWVVLASGVVGVKLSKKVILRDGLFLIGAEILLLILLSSNSLTHWHGWILTSFYVIYLVYALTSMRKGKKVDSTANVEINNNYNNPWYIKYQFRSESGKSARSWILLFISTAIMSIACMGLVESCKGIAYSFNINPLFIALILVAAASSLPDTIISIRDAKKGNYDDSLSNVIGSNIFDITISIGLPLAIYLLITGQEIEFESHGATLIDIRIMLLTVTIVTMAIFYFSKKLDIKHIIILGLLYTVFILYVIGAADYDAGGDSLLARIAGRFIEFLRHPGGIGDTLQNLANKLTKAG